MEEPSSFSAIYEFRGQEYAVNVNVDSEDKMAVEVEDLENADQWRATFDAACEYYYYLMHW